MHNRLDLGGTTKKARRPPPAWPRYASAALSLAFLLAAAVLLWANDRTVTNLLACSLALVCWFLLSWLRR